MQATRKGIKSYLPRTYNHHSRSITSDQRHRLYKEGCGNSVDNGLFIHTIVPKHLEIDHYSGIITELLSIAVPRHCYQR